MTIVRGLVQLCTLLLITGAACISMNLLARVLRRIFSKRDIAKVNPPETQAPVSPPVLALSVPDFSPALLELLVRENPKPMTRSGQGTTPSVFLLLLPGICFAALPEPAQAQAPATVMLQPLHVEAPSQTCVDVEVEGVRQPAFDCLNQQLKAAAQSASTIDPNAQLKAVVGNGEPNKVGTFSYTGESIRMGSNFGKSAFPQRPAAPVYSNSLTAGVK